MKLSQYLSDQRWLLSACTLIFVFINLVIVLDPRLQIHPGSILYMDLACTAIFSAYLAIDFFRKRDSLKRLENESFSPKTFEQQAFQTYILKQQELFSEQITELKQTQKDQMDYMTGWFHEIKTPISVSRLLLETEVQSISLEEELDKINLYVEQALYYSRLNDFHKDYSLQEVDLERLIKEVVKSEAKSFFAKKIRLTLNLVHMEVLSDKKWLSFILRQLLLNAVKYSPSGGEITISLNSNNKSLSLHDKGIGIPLDDLERVFEKGFTGTNGRKNGSSTGMGLYLSKQMADKLGHRLSIASKEGSFTEASLTFPPVKDIYYSL